jgi:hypothetical protein
LFKLFKKKQKQDKPIGVDDILSADAVNAVLEKVQRQAPNISDLLVIYLDKETGEYCWHVTGNTLYSTAVWMLASVQNDMLNQDVSKNQDMPKDDE